MLARDVFHCSVSEVLDRITALEFEQWRVFYREEGLLPSDMRLRHAERQAVAYSAAFNPPAGSDCWRPEHLLRPAWVATKPAPAKPQTLDEIRAAARRAGMEL